MRSRTISAAVIAAVVTIALPCFMPTGFAQTDKETPPDWITDAKTGCKVWNPAPEPHETIHWSGGCKDGFAQGNGTLQWTENGKPGDRYVGGYQTGKRNGHGVVIDAQGNRVEGDWRNDELLQMGVNEI